MPFVIADSALMKLRRLLLGTVVLLGAVSSASAQFYSREESIADKAAGIRWEATSLQKRSEDLLKKDATVQNWKAEVNDWARGTQARANELAKQSQQVDRAKFFAAQSAAINQANAAQIQAQGRAVYQAAQQVSLRTQQVKTFEQQLWQWKDMLDRQDNQIKGGLEQKEAAKNAVAEDLTASNVRLAAFLDSNKKLYDANKAREKDLMKREAEVKARQAAVEKRKLAADAKRKELDEARDNLDTASNALDQLAKALDDQSAAIKRAEGNSSTTK